MKVFSVLVPSLPPFGINETYAVGQAYIDEEGKAKSGRLYKKKDLVDWNEKAIQIIRSKANYLGWSKETEYLSLEFYWWGRNNDVDAFDKNLMDVVGYALEFNDKHILRYVTEKLLEPPSGINESEGFIVRIEFYNPVVRAVGVFLI